jgi:RimJ/RimL family protein N-acetyltransferase
MKLDPTRTMENRFARLEPFTEDHRDDLRSACDADPSVWTDLYPYSMAGEHFDPIWARMKTDLAAGRSIHWAVMAGGRCVGITCYSSYDLPNATLEIGGTYYHPDYRGGATNPAAKRLIMGDAFASGARRVVFRVDAINARSRAAVLKLGAVQEGILRQDRVTWTGRVRDTAIFSVLNDEWPGVRDKLDARLAAFA